MMTPSAPRSCPWRASIAEHLTRDAISKRLGWDDLEFVFTDVDAPNELEQAQIQQILIGCGVLTVNEVRRMRGLPPLPEKRAGLADAPPCSKDLDNECHPSEAAAVRRIDACRWHPLRRHHLPSDRFLANS